MSPSRHEIVTLPAGADPEAVRRIPPSIALRYDVLGLGADENSIAVAVPDPNDSEPIEQLRFATGMRVDAVAAPRELIRRHLAAAYALPAALEGREERDDDPPVVRLWDELVQHALEACASDLHVEPERGVGVARERVEGTLRVARVIPAELFERLVARVKVLAGMDIADRRRPQDGRIAIDRDGSEIDARVATMPTVHGERLVVRFFDRNASAPRLECLGMDESVLAAYRATLRMTHGCVLVAGPTGSGKTTTLYASLYERDDGTRHLCSVEDPVEVQLPGVAQIQVNPRAGLTFEAALRGIVRQDPDVVMIGEIRDAQTAAAALATGLAGQMVLSSLHANDAVGALDRLIELGAQRRAVAASLRAVLAQRLVRCRDGGRTGVFELMIVDDELREMLVSETSCGRIRAALAARSYVGMERRALERAARGELKAGEVERVFGMHVAV